MRKFCLLVTSSIVFFLSACVTTQPANFYNRIPGFVEEISAYRIEFPKTQVPFSVDYKESQYSGAAAQAAGSFGIVGVVVGSLVESAIVESSNSSVKNGALTKSNEIQRSLNIPMVKPAIVSVSKELFPLFNRRIMNSNAESVRLKVSPKIGVSVDAKTLLLKLQYVVDGKGESKDYENSVTWQIRKEQWDKQSIDTELTYGIKEAVEVMVADLSGQFTQADSGSRQKITMFEPNRGFFNENIRVIGWSVDRKNVRIKRSSQRSILSLSQTDFAYIHSRL